MKYVDNSLCILKEEVNLHNDFLLLNNELLSYIKNKMPSIDKNENEFVNFVSKYCELIRHYSYIAKTGLEISDLLQYLVIEFECDKNLYVNLFTHALLLTSISIFIEYNNFKGIKFIFERSYYVYPRYVAIFSFNYMNVNVHFNDYDFSKIIDKIRTSTNISHINLFLSDLLLSSYSVYSCKKPFDDFYWRCYISDNNLNRLHISSALSKFFSSDFISTFSALFGYSNEDDFIEVSKSIEKRKFDEKQQYRSIYFSYSGLRLIADYLKLDNNFNF